MKVGFAVTCQGRAQHVARTLPPSLEGNPNALFVLLDYGSEDNLGEWVLSREHDLLTGRLVYYRLQNPGPFRMGHAKNLAHRLAILEGAEAVCNLDADNYAGDGFGAFIAAHLTEHPDSFLWAKMIPGVLVRGISGRIAMSASTYLKAGGYDERYQTWAPDDKDFTARLGRMGFAAFEIPAKYLLAIKHDNRVRFRAYPHARPPTEEYPLDIPTEGTVANRGRFGCGTVYRNFERIPMALGPVPTRIFGIGWHKTGTTSLATALGILGYDTAHWTSPRWARDIYEEMQKDGKSKTLEQHYALTDFPIPLIYMQLDKAYPGSKFILTERPHDEWIESVEKHYSDRNPYRSTWDKDAFTRKVHSLAYGRSDFHYLTMSCRYKQHNADVHQYFRNRPHDLLVMDKPDWHDLCAFLGKPIPSVPYPQENVTP